METLKKIFYHPNFGIAAGIIGIITGVFGIYAYYASIKEPNLTYYISSTRTPIVQQGKPIERNIGFLVLTEVDNRLSSTFPAVRKFSEEFKIRRSEIPSPKVAVSNFKTLCFGVLVVGS